MNNNNLSSNFSSFYYKLRLPSLSELTPMIFEMGLTHLGSEAFKSCLKCERSQCLSFYIILEFFEQYSYDFHGNFVYIRYKKYKIICY